MRKLVSRLLVAVAIVAAARSALGQVKSKQSSVVSHDNDNVFRLGEKLYASSSFLSGLADGSSQEVMVSFTNRNGNTRRKPDNGAIRTDTTLALASKRAFLARIGDPGIEIVRAFDHLPIALLRVQGSEALRYLLDQPEVVAVFPNASNRLLGTPDLALIGQPAAAAAGYRGAGVTVAIVDGPVDITNPAFGCTAVATPSSCPFLATSHFGTGGSAATGLHATNVAGIVHAVAPSAHLVSLDVFSGDTAFDSDVAEAGDWCISHQAQFNIVAFNASLGGGAYGSPCDDPDPAEALAASLRSAGIVPVIASGNTSHGGALARPGCAPSAISVGAVYSHAVGSYTWSADPPSCTDAVTTADQVACFSNSAPFLGMLGPGVLVDAAGTTFTGTSQATPHVAGAVAVARSGFLSEVMSTTVRRLVQGAPQVTDGLSGVTTPRLSLNGAIFGPFPTCTPQSVSLPFNTSGSLLSSHCFFTNDKSNPFYTDRFQFSASAGQTLHATMVSAEFPPYMQVNAQDGSSPAGSSTGSLSFTFPTSGLWEMSVSADWAWTSGVYQLSATTAAGGLPCVPSGTQLCLNGSRFSVRVGWRVPAQGTSGAGTAIPLTSDTGYFWFFSSNNIELVVKAVDGRAFNGKFWVFYGALSNVEYTITVTDTLTGAVKTYFNPSGTLGSVADTAAF